MTATVTSDEKLLAALSYWCSILLSFIPGLIIFLIKKDESAYVRKHSLQSVLLSLVFIVLSMAIGAITFGLGSLLVWLVSLVYLVVLGVQVFQGTDANIPLITDMIDKNQTA